MAPKMIMVSASAWLLIGALLFGQNHPWKPIQLRVERTRAITAAYVDLELNANDRQLAIPYCHDLLGGTKVLCTGTGAYLEAYTEEGWKPAKLRTTFGILGGVVWDVVRCAIVPTDGKVSLRFEFDRKFFEIEPGQQLRVVIDTYANEPSLRKETANSQFVSDPFECPNIGILP
jgi:hypothetical protein